MVPRVEYKNLICVEAKNKLIKVCFHRGTLPVLTNQRQLPDKPVLFCVINARKSRVLENQDNLVFSTLLNASDHRIVRAQLPLRVGFGREHLSALVICTADFQDTGVRKHQCHSITTHQNLLACWQLLKSILFAHDPGHFGQLESLCIESENLRILAVSVRNERSMDAEVSD